MTAYESKSPEVSSMILELAEGIKMLPSASLVTQLTQMLDDLKTAFGTGDGPKATKLLRKIESIISNQDNGLMIANRRKMYLAGGAYGQDLKGKSNGIPGQDGTLQILPVRIPLDQCDWSVPFVHPVQCRMLLEKAKLKYFLGDTKTLAVSMGLLVQLSERLAFLTLLKPEHKLKKAYDEYARLLFLGEGNAAIEDLMAIRQETATYIRQMRDGRDFYGNALNYVPRGSYESYSGAPTEDVIWKNLQNVESLFRAYLDAAKSDESRIEAIRQVASTASQTIATNNDRIEMLKVEMARDQTKILSYKDSVQHQYDAITAAEAKVEDAIRNAYSVPLSSILGALGQCLMAPSKAMVLVQAVTLTHSAETQLPSDQGDDRKINKEYLIRKMRKVWGDDNKARHASLMEGYTLSKDGTISTNDPGAEMLVAAEKDMLDLIEDYTSTIGKTNMEEIKQAFEQYTSEF
jgi:hypothetical protein